MKSTASRNRYIAIIELNELNQRESAIAQLEKLGMQQTSSQKEWVLVFLFEGENSQFEWIRSLLKSGQFDNCFSVLETSRAPEYLEALPSSSAIAPTEKSWQPLQWLENGVSELAREFGHWRTSCKPPSLHPSGVAMGGEETESKETSSKIEKDLTIQEQSYKLEVSCEDQKENIWRFQLQRSNSSEKIPQGIKLRLLDQDHNPFENNEDQANQTTDALLVRVQLEPGEGLTWETEPHPDNYQPEVLWF